MPLNFDTETFSECISEAAGYERLAYYWANKETDFVYLERIRFTSEDAIYQSKLAASHAVEWYTKAKRAK